jgi:hypothetical protein
VACVTARRVRRKVQREVQHLMGALRQAPVAAPAPQVVDGGYISSDSADV